MSHPTTESLLALRDGALTVAARRDVQEHLDVCLDCRGRLNELAALIEPHLRQTAPAGGRETFYESFTRRVDGRVQGGEWALEGDAARRKGSSAAHRIVLGGVVVAVALVGLTMIVQPRLSIEDLASRMLKLNAGLPGSPKPAAEGTAPSAVTTTPPSATAPATVTAAPPSVTPPSLPTTTPQAAAAPPAVATTPHHATSPLTVASPAVSTVDAVAQAPVEPASSAAQTAAPAGASTVAAPGSPLAAPSPAPALAPTDPLAPASPTSASASLAPVAPLPPPVVYASPARLKELIERARSLSAVAERRSRAQFHDAAAVAWERVRDAARASNPVRPEAADRAADERYSAWAHSRNSSRELAARRALAVAMAGTPKGPERDHLNELLQMVRTIPAKP